MKFKKCLLVLSLFTLTLGGFTSCNNNNQSSQGVTDPKDMYDVVPTEIDHYFSNRISFADLGITLGNNKFMKNKVAKLKVKSVTDGDTAVFYLDGEKDSYTNVLGNEYDYLTVRFLGIDTPESSSNVDPWGKKASKYVKKLLREAKSVIVDASSIDISKCETIYDSYSSGIRLDSNGTRWLGMIWYCPSDKDDTDLKNYRSLQLDVIEECYSAYTGNLGGDQIIYTANKETEPKLYERYKDTYGSLTLSEVLLEADIRSRILEVRKTGNQVDDNYDYSETPTSASIKEVYENWDAWEENAKFLELTGVITSFIGSNFYFQDENGYPLYVYMGISGKSINKMFKVGDTIKIRGRLATYGGQKQLTDIIFKEETFTKITKEEDKIAMPSAIQLDGSKLVRSELDANLSKLVTVTLTGKSLGRESKDKSYTLYATNEISGLGGTYNTMSIRINGTLAPGYEREDFVSTWPGNTYKVTGILAIYQEDEYTKTESYPSYQITVGNRPLSDDAEKTPISEIVKQ